MLRLGHIDYANCVPVHALLLDGGTPDTVCITTGVPSELNAALAAGAVDVAPSSSIEYARHADRYRIVPSVAIGSLGPVQSILLETTRPVEDLDDLDVALPTASATSVVLLRALLEQRDGVRPRYRRFDQTTVNPFDDGAAAALWIGDAALRRAARTDRDLVDLGAAWTEWTGLPFVYALWQASAGVDRDRELAALHGLLLESVAYFGANAGALAERHAGRYGLSADGLLAYWRSLEYGLSDAMRQGLLRFYALAVELGEAPAVPRLRWTPRAP